MTITHCDNSFFNFIYFWLRWVFPTARGLSLVGTSRGYPLAVSCGFLVWRLLLLWGTDFSTFSLQVPELGISSRGPWAWLLQGRWDLPGPGVEPYPLHWQVGSYPLDHQGSPRIHFDLWLLGCDGNWWSHPLRKETRIRRCFPKPSVYAHCFHEHSDMTCASGENLTHFQGPSLLLSPSGSP